MSIILNREEFDELGRIQKEELRLEEFSNKGWISTSHVFRRHFGEYQSNKPEHKEFFKKLINSLELISKRQSYEILYDEENLGYKGTYFREEDCKELDGQIQKIKDNSKDDFIEKFMSGEF